MTIDYTIIEEDQLVIAKGSGIITSDDVRKHLDALATDERYDPPMKKLVDYRSINGIQQTNKEIYSLVLKKERKVEKFAGEKCAFVTSDDLAFGITRVYEAYIDGDGLNVATFKSIKEALKWLGVELNRTDIL